MIFFWYSKSIYKIRKSQEVWGLPDQKWSCNSRFSIGWALKAPPYTCRVKETCRTDFLDLTLLKKAWSRYVIMTLAGSIKACKSGKAWKRTCALQLEPETKRLSFGDIHWAESLQSILIRFNSIFKKTYIYFYIFKSSFEVQFISNKTENAVFTPKLSNANAKQCQCQAMLMLSNAKY